MDPARRRESSAALLVVLSLGSLLGEGDLKGLCEGVGRVLLAPIAGGTLSPGAPPGENRDGTVPARPRLVCGESGLGRPEKSGKPSVGDSGMFSRSGVELPLVGGPQGFGTTPSCACISRALFHIRGTI